MANTVTFYQTPFDRQNRLSTVYDYIRYFASNSGTDVNVNYAVMPNVPFVVPVSAISAENILHYNYIQFVYNDIAQYAFIDKIEYFANENAYYVYHSKDNWYAYLSEFSSYGLPYGVMTRGHTHDISSSTYYPEFYDTFSTPEETFPTTALKTQRFVPSKQTSSIQCLWLYIYIANPLTLFTDFKWQSFYKYNEYNVAQTGVTLCYPYVLYGSRWFAIAHSEGGDTSSFEITDLTNSNITSMTISPIPPTDSLTGAVYYTAEYYDLTARNYLTYVTNTTGMPPYANYIQQMAMIGFTTSELWSAVGGTTKVNFNTYTRTYTGKYLDKNTVDSTSLFTYYLLNGIPKLQSSVYNPMYLENLFIQSDYLPDTDTEFIYVGISGDLTQYCYIMTGNGVTGSLGSFHYKNITSTFSPTVLVDYWTRLNASIESLNAQQQRATAVLNGISNVVSGVSSAVSGVASATTGNVAGAVSGLTGALSSGFNIASNAVNIGYTQQITNANQEIAEYQYQTGNTNESGALYLAGIYALTDVPSINIIVNYGNLTYVAMGLHRHGYNANVPFYYLFSTHNSQLCFNTNYKRSKFNYVQADEVFIPKMNKSMLDDIREMFNNGVTFWNVLTDGSYTGADSTKIANAGNIYQINFIDNIGLDLS